MSERACCEEAAENNSAALLYPRVVRLAIVKGRLDDTQGKLQIDEGYCTETHVTHYKIGI